LRLAIPARRQTVITDQVATGISSFPGISVIRNPQIVLLTSDTQW